MIFIFLENGDNNDNKPKKLLILIHDMPIIKCRIKAQVDGLYGNKDPTRWGPHSHKNCPSGRYKM